MKPQRYRLYLNGHFYGTGSLNYMYELFHNYVIVNRLYGNDEVEFKIVKMKEDEE